MAFIKNNKKFITIYTLLCLIGLISIVFSYNNHSFYKDTIVKVINTKEEYQSTNTINNKYKEDIYIQTIEAFILNGQDKGTKVTFTNEYHKGQAYDQKYQKGDELFVSLNKKDDIIKNTRIVGYKRDKYIIILIVSFILTITLIGKLKGFLSVISVVLNIILFAIISIINKYGISLVLLSLIASIIFSIVCLTLVSGINKKSLSAIISSTIGVIVTTIISLIVMKLTKYEGIRFEQMELLTRPYEEIFISEIILGGLGAIMDISISISSSLNELIDKDNKITTKQLTKSGIAIGKDIMSTMINVLFFTYICSIITNLTIYFRNGVSINSLINEYISLEMTRALTGAIGITITIPIAIFITTFIHKRRDNV